MSESVTQIDLVSGGVTTASVTAGNMYAIIFEPHTESRVYTVQSTAGTEAFTPSAPTNFLQSTDTNGDSRTTALDTLIVVNQLDRMQNDEGQQSSAAFMYDVNRDGDTTALDALLIINEVSRRNDTSSESELVLSTDPQTVSRSSPLTTAKQQDDEDLMGMRLDEATVDTATVAGADSFQSQAVAEFAFENETDVSEDDLDLLAEDLQQTLSIRDFLANQL